MKKLILALVVAVLAMPALAQYRVAAYQWEGTAGIDGAAITSAVIDTGKYDALTIVGTAATTDRAIQISCIAKDGTTALFTYADVAIAVATQAKVLVQVRPDVTVPGTAPTGVTYISTTLCPRMKVTIPSVTGGAGVGATLAITARQNPNATKPVRYQYESGSVTAGAALTTGVIDTAKLENLQVIVEATTTNRTLVVSCMAKDGTTANFDFASLTVTAGSKFMRTFRADAPIPGSEPTGVVHIPVDLCPKMKASIAAAGAASAKLAAYGR